MRPSHAHTTANGIEVHIWTRRGWHKGKKGGGLVWHYMARFRIDGKRVGHTLGEDIDQAEAELRRVMTQIEDGTYVAPSSPEAKRRRKRRAIPSLTVSDLIAEYLADRRAHKGKKTARTYAGRLAHVEAFTERDDIRRRYPLARDIDREFVAELNTFLRHREVARNGHRNGDKRLMAASTRREVLQRLKAVLTWGCRPDVRKLPPEFVQPVSNELIGKKPMKDPLRPIVYGLERRGRMARMADAYQLVTLALQFVLPLRPEQVAGLMISDIDWAEGTLRFGTRFDGNDFSKGKTSWRVPFPPELESLLRAAVGDRVDGPVFLKRSVVEGRSTPSVAVCERGDVEAAICRALSDAGGELQADGDAKETVRRTIAAAGGVTTDHLRDEFLTLANLAGIDANDRYYEVRSDVESEIKRVGVEQGCRRYIMGHTVDPNGELASYDKLTIDELKAALQPYWGFARSLLDAIRERSVALGLADDRPATIRLAQPAALTAAG